MAKLTFVVMHLAAFAAGFVTAVCLLVLFTA